MQIVCGILPAAPVFYAINKGSNAGVNIAYNTLGLKHWNIPVLAIRVFLTKTAKSQSVSINSDLSPAPRRPTAGCLREIDQFPEVDPIADIQEAVGPVEVHMLPA